MSRAQVFSLYVYRKGRGGLAGLLAAVARLCPRLCPTPQAQRCGPRRATTTFTVLDS